MTLEDQIRIILDQASRHIVHGVQIERDLQSRLSKLAAETPAKDRYALLERLSFHLQDRILSDGHLPSGVNAPFDSVSSYLASRMNIADWDQRRMQAEAQLEQLDSELEDLMAAYDTANPITDTDG